MRVINKIGVLIFVVLFLLIQQPLVYALSTRKGIVGEKVIKDPSARYIHYHRTLPSGAGVELHVVKIRLDDKSLEIRPALEGGKIKDSAILADIAKAEGAIAAINGGFFFEQGGRKLPVGELIINGGLFSHSDVARGCFIVDGEGEVIFDVLKVAAFLNPVDYYEPIRIHEMNVPPGGMRDAVYIFNRYWGTVTPPGEADEITVENGAVTGKSVSGGTSIPEDGYVISLRGGWRPDAKRFTVGLTVGIIYDFRGEKGTIRHMLTGGPMFVKDGWWRDYKDEYRFSSNVTAPADRSCMCRTWNEEILLVCTRGARLSYGQLADLLIDLNVREAVGLDGGGSSGMWVAGVDVPAPSRAVPNAVVVVAARGDGAEGNISSGGLWGK